MPSRLLRASAALVLSLGLAGSARLDAQPTYEVFHQCVTPGGQPDGPLLIETDGSIYGVMRSGGVWSRGSIFSLTPDGGGGYTYADLYSFSGPEGSFPEKGVVRGADGALYGATSQGAGQGVGSFYRLDSRNRLTAIHHIAVGEVSSMSPMILGPDGNFYGTSEGGGAHGKGSIFRLSPGGAFSDIYDFPGGADGQRPRGGLVLGPDGRLYGTTTMGGSGGVGVLFASTTGGVVTTLHPFGASTDGFSPDQGVTVGADGLLYGTAPGGGASNHGTVFRSTTGGEFTKLFDFPGTAPQGGTPASRLVLAPDGKLYGTTAPIPQFPGPDVPSTLFRVDTSGAVTTIDAAGGFHPGGPLVLGPDGLLYSALSPSSPSPVDNGSIDRMDLTGGVATVYAVPFVHEAQHPFGMLTELPDGTFAGLAASLNFGGDILYGLDAQGRTSTLHVFTDLSVVEEVLLASDGLFYGAVGFADGENFGGLLRIEANGDETTLHAFDGTDGNGPIGLFELAGEIWGMTQQGGADGNGTVFKLDAARAFHPIHDFTNAEGAGLPTGRLALATDGNLYGTTALSNNSGTLFRLVPGTGAVTIIHDFMGNDGANPAWLIAGSDGLLYGTTSGGGASGLGKAFHADLTGAVTPIHDFDVQANPYLTEADPGSFYGTTPGFDIGFPPDDGSVFRMDGTGQVTDVHDFADVFGDNLKVPLSPLLYASNGGLYGTTRDGGFAGVGGIFRIIPGTPDPVIDAISPTSGSAAGGTAVIVSGHHFRTAHVTFGGVPAVTTFTAREALATTDTPPLPPGTTQDVTLTNLDATTVTLPGAFFADFLDVANDHLFHDYVETLVRHGVTAGCGGGDYCPASPVRRDQMAVFLLKAEHGSGYVPPQCQGVFGDVACPSPFADWIEQLAAEGITGGCGNGDYCPADSVRRDQMSAFLLKAEHGSAYTPPACAGLFPDVACPSLFADWIEQLAAEQITGGCGNGNYCPLNPNTRGQMAVFLVKTFGLQ